MRSATAPGVVIEGESTGTATRRAATDSWQPSGRIATMGPHRPRSPSAMAIRTHVDLDRARIKELTEREAEKLNARTPGSQTFYERARQTLVGGVASSYQTRDPWPIYLSH